MEQRSSCLELVLGQDRKLRDHHNNQQWNLDGNGLIVENNFLAHQIRIKHPSESGKSCHLEDLWRVTLSQWYFLIWQFLSEYLKSNCEIAELFDISQHDSKWINEHRNDTEFLCKSHDGDVVSEPHDHESVEENPCNRNDQSKRVVIVISLTKRTRNGKELSMGQWHLKNIFRDTFNSSVSWAVNVESFFVDCLVNKLIDDRLRNSLWLTHKFFFKENLLPVKFVLLFVREHLLIFIFWLIWFIHIFTVFIDVFLANYIDNIVIFFLRPLRILVLVRFSSTLIFTSNSSTF